MTNLRKLRLSAAEKRAILYARDPYCYYCGILTIQYQALYKQGAKKGSPFPEDMATLEHLYDKFDYKRRVESALANDDSRHVIACFKCNQTRGLLRLKTMPKEILEERKVYLAAMREKYKQGRLAQSG